MDLFLLYKLYTNVYIYKKDKNTYLIAKLPPLRHKFLALILHGFFSVRQFLSHITKFPRGFPSRGIFLFTEILFSWDYQSNVNVCPLRGISIPYVKRFMR